MEGPVTIVAAIEDHPGTAQTGRLVTLLGSIYNGLTLRIGVQGPALGQRDDPDRIPLTVPR